MCEHLRNGAESLELFGNKLYAGGENMMALSEHAQAQSAAHLIHVAMTDFGLPADSAPYHEVRIMRVCLEMSIVIVMFV